MVSQEDISEYFLVERLSDIEALRVNSTIKIDFNENPIIKQTLEEEREDFKKTLRNGIIKAYVTYTFEPEELANIAEAVKTFRNIKTEVSIPINVRMSEVNAQDHENTIISFPCEIFAIGKEQTTTLSAMYHCYKDDEDFQIIGANDSPACPTCGRKLELQTILESESVQTITLRELNDESLYSSQHRLMADIHREDVNQSHFGEKKIITGIFRSIPAKKRGMQVIKTVKNDVMIDVVSMEDKEEDKTIIPDELMLSTYKQMSKDKKLIKHLVASYAWHIAGHDNEKLAMLLGIVGGNKEENHRGLIHILFVGDPATAKSEIMKWMKRVSHRGAITAGAGSSGVGLCMAMVNMPDGTSALTPGPVVLYSGGHVFIDEFDKMEKHDRQIFHIIMEDGVCRRSLAGAGESEAPAETAIFASANPKYSKWNKNEPIMDNINIEDSMFSRFDLKFRFLDDANKEQDLLISEHIMNSREGRPDGILGEEDLLAFLNFARAIKPKMPKQMERELSTFFAERTTITQQEDTVPIDRRQYEALIRISTAFAKLLLRTRVDKECLEYAIKIFKAQYESFGLSFDQGDSMAQQGLETGHMTKEALFKLAIRELKKKMGICMKPDLILALVKNHCCKDDEHAKNTIAKWYRDTRITIQDNGAIDLIESN